VKINQLTFTRFIAAIFIVIYHSGRNVMPFNQAILRDIFLNANLGVSYFFILSGFVMIIAYGQKQGLINKRSYYLNRVSRIYPCYIFALLITTLLVIRNHGVFLKAFLLGATLTQAWVPPYAVSLNSPGWSLSVEVLFYLSFPFLFNYIYRKCTTKSIALYIVAFWILSQCLLNYLSFSGFNKGYGTDSDNFISFFPLLHLNEFLVGNLIGLIYLGAKTGNKNYDVYLVLLLVAMGLFSYLDAHFGFQLNIHGGIMALFFAPFILLLAKGGNGILPKILSGKKLIVLGEISYSIYIIQGPVSLMVNYFYRTAHIKQPELMFYLYVIILLITSVICYYTIEVPVGNWLRVKFNASKATVKAIE
jgi:peptidoglycan/LPS O-acetylase OafA/YrhL